MPKIDPFIESIEARIVRISQRVKTQEEHRRETAKPEYWREQRRRANDPNVRSYDALTEWIA